ncbi:MAG: hypothetical protein COT09_04075 [Candidatus Hydromicrobium americanum]|nr:MAG: hypothetical protein COT09_04075 [Candidatus Hydromicrobium americanum]
MMRVEDKYTDVLQNIEFGIVMTYRDHPELSDYGVMRMLKALIDSYIAEKIGRSPRHFPLSDVERLLLENVRRMCEWRLGRASLSNDVSKDKEIVPEPRSVDEIVLCLKRILKSVNRWNKRGGRQGYLNFIIQYVQ